MSMEMGGQGQPGGDGQGASGQGGPDGQSQGVDSYTAANEYTEDTTVSNETIESIGTDENAALISSGASVTLDNDTITRTSEDSKGGDNSSFYGVGAAVLATDGTAYVKDDTYTIVLINLSQKESFSTLIEIEGVEFQNMRTYTSSEYVKWKHKKINPSQSGLRSITVPKYSVVTVTGKMKNHEVE